MSIELLTREAEHDHVTISYDPIENEVRWSSHWTFDRENWECENDSGHVLGDIWLDALASESIQPRQHVPRISSLGSDRYARDQLHQASNLAAVAWLGLPDSSRSHLFLDSFSVIENREEARRRDRVMTPSPVTKVLLDIVARNPTSLRDVTPREFEVICAAALAHGGFSNVVLRRYVKDEGADIVALLADGPEPEVVLVEVKHSGRAAGIAALDRLNGARDRVGAHRALLITSSHVSREGERAYEAKSAHVTAHTWGELQSWLRDSPDWSPSPRGLWSKSTYPTRAHRDPQTG